jgi:hypothetical protein
LNPVGGWRSHEPWKATYMFLASLSKVFQIGAECAWKLRRGGIAFWEVHDASLKVLLGETTNMLPVLSDVPGKLEASQTVKQVG